MKAILQILQSNVLPQLQTAECRMVVARPEMAQASMPEGTLLERRPMLGIRTPVKNRRSFSNQRRFTAEWLQSNQQEMLFPKIAYVVEGKADYLLGDYCVHANRGDFIIIPPGAPHHAKGPFLDKHHYKNGACTVLFAHVHGHGIFLWFSSSAHGVHRNNISNSYHIPNMAAVQMLHMLMDEAVASDRDWKQICQGLLSTFFAVLARELMQGRFMASVQSEIPTIQSLSDEDFLTRVQSYIRTNLHKRLKVEDVARHTYMSPTHFSRTLRRRAGKTFVEILTECRLQRARELLTDSDWTAAYIAGFVGLKSSAYFHEFFQHHQGCTPLEYRKKHQKQRKS